MNELSCWLADCQGREHDRGYKLHSMHRHLKNYVLGNEKLQKNEGTG